MNTHHEATDHPLTEGRAWDIYSDAHPVDAIRAAFDAGRKYERAALELPTDPGSVIVPADGHEYIEAEVWGKTYHASEAILLGERDWLGAWRSPHGVQVDVTSGQITPGTWKVGNR